MSTVLSLATYMNHFVHCLSVSLMGSHTLLSELPQVIYLFLYYSGLEAFIIISCFVYLPYYQITKLCI